MILYVYTQPFNNYIVRRHVPASQTNTLRQHNPQLDDPLNPFNQSQRGTGAKQERVETKGDDIGNMPKGYVIRG